MEWKCTNRQKRASCLIIGANPNDLIDSQCSLFCKCLVKKKKVKNGLWTRFDKFSGFLNLNSIENYRIHHQGNCPRVFQKLYENWQ